jgi:hypothetical protein
MIALAAGDSVTARSMLARTIQLNARFSPTQGRSPSGRFGR